MEYCKNCEYFSHKLLQHNNLRYYWSKNCILFNSKLNQSKEKCKHNYFKEKTKIIGKMNVVDMIAWEDRNNYICCEEQNNFKDFWNCVKIFLVDNNIKFNGSWHQNWEYGVPVIEHEGKLYAFTVSMRRWGKLMSEAFNSENKNPLSYIDWAFCIPEGECITVDEYKNPIK